MPTLLAKRRLVSIRYQWQLFCLALMFFTRLPVAKNLPYSDKRMNQANRYFSLVGIVVGCLVVLSYCLFVALFPQSIAIILAMITSVFITGAFHEDGLADMADGIGGGYSREKRLMIMKDSRIGTYGTVTLTLALLLKFALLVELATLNLAVISLVSAYAISRACAASLIFDTAYVSDEGTSKSKPLAAQQSSTELIILIGFALIPCLFFPWFFTASFQLLLVLFIVLFVFRLAFRRWIIARIGGFTGDCLGAAQQVSELLIYLVILHHMTHVGGS